jgi:hypothetical protein
MNTEYIYRSIVVMKDISIEISTYLLSPEHEHIINARKYYDGEEISVLILFTSVFSIL